MRRGPAAIFDGPVGARPRNDPVPPGRTYREPRHQQVDASPEPTPGPQSYSHIHWNTHRSPAFSLRGRVESGPVAKPLDATPGPADYDPVKCLGHVSKGLPF